MEGISFTPNVCNQLLVKSTVTLYKTGRKVANKEEIIFRQEKDRPHTVCRRSRNFEGFAINLFLDCTFPSAISLPDFHMFE